MRPSFFSNILSYIIFILLFLLCIIIIYCNKLKQNNNIYDENPVEDEDKILNDI
jgi:hypothetical protein